MLIHAGASGVGIAAIQLARFYGAYALFITTVATRLLTSSRFA